LVPFVDLKAQYQSIRHEIEPAVIKVLENAQFVLGPAVVDFEQKFATYTSCRYAIGVNSGTSALHVALLAAGVGPGDEVITVPNTFVATVAAITYTGATTRFVDINPVNFNMDPKLLEAAITPKTKVILPVHLYGQCADMDPILEIAKRHNLIVIEDCAQAHGAEYNKQRAGSMGAMGCFSFYPGKNLGAYGEGGAVVTDDDQYRQTMNYLRDWGGPKYKHDMVAYNYRLHGVQGAVLGVKMKYIEAWTEARRLHARQYNERLAGVQGVVIPVEEKYARHVYHIYAIRVQNREHVISVLNEKGVQNGIHYPIPVHMQKGYQFLGYHKGQFPHSEKASDEVLSLPMFPEMTLAQIDEVCNAVKVAVQG